RWSTGGGAGVGRAGRNRDVAQLAGIEHAVSAPRRTIGIVGRCAARRAAEIMRADRRDRHIAALRRAGAGVLGRVVGGGSAVVAVGRAGARRTARNGRVARFAGLLDAVAADGGAVGV